MLPSTGYFDSIPCPFHAKGLCQRPYCHFKHGKVQEDREQKQRQQAGTSASSSASAARDEDKDKAAAAAAAAAAGDKAPVAAVVRQKSLEDLVQDAVKKVLLAASTSPSSSSGAAVVDPEALLAKLDASKIAAALAPLQQSGAGADDPIYGPDATDAAIDKLKSAGVKREPDDESYSTLSTSSGEVNPPRASTSASSSHVPSGLDRLSSLKPPSSSSSSRAIIAPKTSFVREAVLGDLGDLTDSEDEAVASKDSSHLVGSILMEGARSGVLTGVDELQQEVIKNKMRLKEKRQKEKERAKKEKEEKISCDKVSSSSEAPAEAEAASAAAEVAVVKKEPEETPEEKASREKREEAERAAEETKKAEEKKRREVEKREQKRKVLENYYKDKNVGVGGEGDAGKSTSEKKEDGAIMISSDSGERDDDTSSTYDSDSFSEDDESYSDTSSYSSSSEVSSDESDRRSRRRRKSRKEDRRRSSKRRRSLSDEGRRGRSRRKDRKRSRRGHRRRRSTSRHKKRRKRSRSRSRSRSRRKRRRRESDRDRVKIKKEKADKGEVTVKKEKVEEVKVKKEKDQTPKVAQVKVEKPEAQRKKVDKDDDKVPAETARKEAVIPSKEKKEDEGIEKMAPRQSPPSTDDAAAAAPAEDEEDEANLPDSVKSFLDIMNELDAANEIDYKKRKLAAKEDKKASSSSLAAVKREDKSNKKGSVEKSKERRESEKGETKSSHHGHHHHRSSSHKSSSHKHSSREKSHHESSSKERHHKSNRSSSKEESSKRRDAKKHSDSSLHKKSSKKADQTEKTPEEALKKREEDEIRQTLAGETSPLPDFSFELDQLPEELDDFRNDVGDDVDDPFAGGDDEVDDEELKRIFDEYQPPAKKTAVEDPSQKKANRLLDEKRKDDRSDANDVAASAEATPTIAAKKRVAHASSGEADRKRPAAFSASSTTKRQGKPTPAQAMMNRFKQLQTKQQDDDLDAALSELTEGKKRRVAHAASGDPNAAKSQLQRKLDARRAATESDPHKRTVGHTMKGLPRLAHTPTDANFLRKPLIAPDAGASAGKVPSNIRQRYLDSIVEECLKLHPGDKQAAYDKAVKEEQACHARSKSRNIYLNVVVNRIKKLRGEVAEAKASGGAPRPSTSAAAVATLSSPAASGSPTKANLITTHMQVLAGKPGSVGTWSIEKPRRESDEVVGWDVYYAVLKRYVMTREQLEENGYPMPDPAEKGKAIVKEDPLRPRKPQPAEWDRRNCDRCLREYRVDEDGRQAEKEECVYHWGRLFKRRGNRATGYIQEGCQVHACHVTDVLDYNDMRGFVATLDKKSKDASSDHGVFALDCEMCSTVSGNELTRVTVVDLDGKTVYESLVRPDADIIDHNTRFSGITESDLAGVTTTILDVQAVLLSMFSSRTILIGHSLESDLKALKMLHGTVIDTSLVFPHKMGRPYKRALRALAAEHLKRIIQNDVGGHDSAEDALACLDLMKAKAKEDIKRLKQLAAVEARKQQKK